jgi:UV excision repair protein RAD23
MADIYHTLESMKNEHAALNLFAEFLKKNYPIEDGVFSQSPSAFLAAFGFTPADFALAAAPPPGEPETLYDSLLGHFTAEQHQVIRRLESKGFDSMTVLQVYQACNCDENSTEECLRTLGG